MLRGFRLLPHTADVGIAAHGDSMAYAYEEAARGLFAIIGDLRTVRPRQTIEVAVKSSDPESLLVDWLNELIFRFDAHGMLFRRFVIYKFTPTSLSARCYGEKADVKRHRIKTGVKAATYHMASVEAGPPAKLRVYVDI